MIGVVPAALSGTLVPFSWFGSLGTVGLDIDMHPVSLSLMALVVFIVGFISALFGNLKNRIFLLIPSLILSVTPVTHLSLDTTMLSITDELISNESALSEPKSIGYARDYDRWFVIPAMRLFCPITDILDESALEEKLIEKDVADELVVIATSKLKDIDDKSSLYINSRDMLSNTTGDNGELIEFEPTYPNGPAAYKKYWAGRVKAHEILKLATQNQTALQNEIDNLAGIQQLADSESAINSAEQIVRNWLYTAIYTCFSFLVLGIYLWGNRFGTLPVIVSTVIVILGSIMENSILHSLYPIFVWLLVSASLYVLLLAIKENLPVIKQFSDTKSGAPGVSTKALLVRCTLLWLPALVLIALAYYASSYWQKGVENYAYLGIDEIGQLVDPKAQPDIVFSYRDKYPTESLETHVHRLNSASINSVEFMILERAANLQTDVAALGGDTQAATITVMYDVENPIVPKSLTDINPIFKKEEFSFEFSLEYIKKVLKEQLKTGSRSVYLQTRKKSKRNLNEELSKLNKNGEASAEAIAEAVNANIKSLAYDTKMKNRKSIIVWFNFLSILFLINVFILLFAAVNSFITIFARLIYHPKYGGLTFSLADITRSRLDIFDLGKDPIETRKNLGNEDNEYIIHASGKDLCVLAQDLNLDGTTGHFNFPQRSKLPFRRLLSGRYNLLNIDREPGIRTKYRHEGVSNFVECILKEKSGIIFDINSLLMLRGEVKLEGVLTMHAASKIMLNNYLTVAHGEGSVLLKVRGKSPEGNQLTATDLVSPFDVVGFDLGCKFDTHWNQSIWSLYFHNAKIRSNDSTRTVLQASGRGNSFGGIIRSLKYILLPV